MSKVTVNDLNSLQNETTALNTINGNDGILAAAFDNTISRDGTTPNQMLSNLDMNSNHILNLPEPSSDNDPIRKIDLTNVSTITNLIHTASSTSNTIGTGSKSFTVPSGLGFQTGQFVLVQQATNTANYMGGRITSYSGTTLVTSMTAFGGSGTLTNWTIDVSGAPGATGNQGPPTNVFDTRTLAMAATIPGGVNVIRTNAYDSSFTDNSGAVFARLTAGTPFLDSFPLTGTIVGGGGYISGTYYGVPLGGSSTGNGMQATVVVSGGSVTSVNYVTQPGNAYKVGDILTQANSFLGGVGSGFTYTIATVSTPLASFTNAVDNSLWQYLPNKCFPHVNEFGAKPDWISTDAGSTNNFNAIQAALFYAGHISVTLEGNGGFQGNVVQCSTGSYMFGSSPAASLIVPFGVYLQGTFGTTLKVSDGFDPGTHAITLGDPNSHLACLRAGLRNISVVFKRDLAVGNDIYMVYSNNTQDGGGMDHVYLYCGNRGGIKYEIGYGGASGVEFNNISINFAGTNSAFECNVGTTVVDCRNMVIGAPSSGINNTLNCVSLSGSGGMYKFDGGHMEQCPNGFLVNLSGSSMVSIKNYTGGNGLNQLVSLANTNTIGNLSLEQCAKNGASNLVLNGQSSGSNRAADVTPKDAIVFFNP